MGEYLKRRLCFLNRANIKEWQAGLIWFRFFLFLKSEI